MKLRNKRTGEVTDNIYVYEDFICVDVWKGDSGIYDSLAELNEEWEDYDPKEPLINDEKIRKAVRAWAEANRHVLIQYDKAKDCLYFVCGTDINDTSLSINFDDLCAFKELEHRHLYTVAELCGEEEE